MIVKIVMLGRTMSIMASFDLYIYVINFQSDTSMTIVNIKDQNWLSTMNLLSPGPLLGYIGKEREKRDALEC